jgi:hypothetical protein
MFSAQVDLNRTTCKNEEELTLNPLFQHSSETENSLKRMRYSAIHEKAFHEFF